MADRQYATLDNPLLHGRLRSNFSSRNYIKRPVKQPQPRILSDIIQRHAAPVNNRQVYLGRSIKPTTKAVNQDIIIISRSTGEVTTHAGNQTLNKSQASKVVSQNKIRNSKPKNASKKIINKLQVGLMAIAVVMIGLGTYATFVGWHTNHIVQVQATKLTQQANKATTGQNTTALSTVKPTQAVVASYIVAPNLPRYLIIPKLGVYSRVISVGVTATGALGTPNNVYDTAWYNESAGPGQSGAMLMDGHVSSWTVPGVFYAIKTLVAGDAIEVERGDGTTFTYKVVSSQVYSSKSVNMTAAMTAIVPGQPGLNLISCTGDVIPGTSEFNERIIVFATLE
jgi:hypothetical protein